MPKILLQKPENQSVMKTSLIIDKLELNQNIKTENPLFDEADSLQKLKKYLPVQAPLKDFIFQNPLRAFQTLKFETAINKASEIFGYKVALSLAEYRELYAQQKINQAVLDKVITARKGADDLALWRDKVLNHSYQTTIISRIGRLRANWKYGYQLDLDSLVHPTLFRVLCSYLDQGIAIWQFPVHHLGFLQSVIELEKRNYTSLFETPRAKALLLSENCKISDLLAILVGNEAWYEQYLFDQQFAHQGWAGMISAIEDQPNTLLDTKSITLKELILLELLLEIDALDYHLGKAWQALGKVLKTQPQPWFAEDSTCELNDVLLIWQNALEWTYYDQVLAGIQWQKPRAEEVNQKSFQALFCIDDRECSIRRYVEQFDPNCETFGTPGFFGVEFYFKPEHGKFYTKLCPPPVTPKYLIKETLTESKRKKEAHFHKPTHSLFRGFVLSQTLGFWSAFKLFLSIFRPSVSPATSYSFRHMDKNGTLSIENQDINEVENNLQVGFTISEMADRVEGVLRNIGLIKDFAPIVYAIGHGASSVNNPFYTTMDCGACSCRPGSVNARVFCFMANHLKVRELLVARGIEIPVSTRFVGALHDTTRDEMLFFDEAECGNEVKTLHQKNQAVFRLALDYNAKERSRRFEITNTRLRMKKLHNQVKRRSVALFEPRPEYDHATNALCIVGRRSLTKHLFLDRRSFLNSYNYATDPEGKFLFNIMKPLGSVCGGINLNYFFSRIDNQKLGAGTKLPHNVMGLFGVANGIEGDLRVGLPSQMIEIHDPLRLLMIVEHYPEVVLNTIQKSNEIYEWYQNEWINLVAVHPETQALFRYKDGQFEPYCTVNQAVEEVNNLNPLVESNQDNFPVYQI
jgi:uncharacterized protein